MTKRFSATLVAGASVLAVAFPSGATAAPNWEDPPECKPLMQWAPSGRPALYAKMGERKEVIQYGGGTEVRYIWQWEVSVPNSKYGWLSAGYAEKLCGADWYPSTA